MVCSYCGLPTDGGQNHGTTEQCIQALAVEAQRLRGARVRAVSSPEVAASSPEVIGRESAEANEPDERPEQHGC
jgi:hypothetical protein